MEEVLKFAEENKDQNLQELLTFLSIPSVSTQPEHKSDVKKAAQWLAANMEEAGLENIKIIENGGHPLVYSDWLHAGDNAPTVLIYGHYDVQPAEPFELWNSPPFEPQLRDDFIYARGVSDDKGQLFIHVKAVEAYLKTSGKLPVNVKFIVEGEEEIGGESLEKFIPQNKELLAADVTLISDTAMLSREQPAIVYSLRGNVYTFLDITGPERDLHSGSYGGAINNPLNALGHIIAALKDEDGHILIPGFYDKVRPLSEEERAKLKEVPFDEAVWLKESGAPQSWGEADFSIKERLGVRPTLDVHGIIGGYTGPGRKTILPSSVHAKISMRLVPDQDPEEIAKLYEEYVKEITPPSVNVKVTICSTSVPTISEMHSPAMSAASNAYESVFGCKPVYLREGGSIPVVGEFQDVLGLESVMTGFGLPNDRIHSPNERFYLPNFYKGVETIIHFLNQYADLYAGDDK
ncbi:MAG: dipeptidase [Candidatus Promineifilaceae bacterium]|jgi:acetylornithine deacetylase/succinyl-diaminopimelate desuccinylase-like protein